LFYFFSSKEGWVQQRACFSPRGKNKSVFPSRAWEGEHYFFSNTEVDGKNGAPVFSPRGKSKNLFPLPRLGRGTLPFDFFLQNGGGLGCSGGPVFFPRGKNKNLSPSRLGGG
jgi:hypothetical protein